MAGGGNPNQLASVEVLTDNGWEMFTPALQTAMSGHCMVTRFPSTVMVIGGNQGGINSANTYTLTDLQTSWTKEPPLNFVHRLHSCGKISENGKIAKFSTIVVGGYNGHGIFLLSSF